MLHMGREKFMNKLTIQQTMPWDVQRDFMKNEAIRKIGRRARRQMEPIVWDQVEQQVRNDVYNPSDLRVMSSILPKKRKAKA